MIKIMSIAYNLMLITFLKGKINNERLTIYIKYKDNVAKHNGSSVFASHQI
jgi:hypothetical protein